ncbi:helix-turn-helix domain-containing protein [Butyrivibrio sp. AE2032]|uniref:helix-turn-helix domain-containing protein n=1 Tax=Butyrivibrio sp. AE2032 TaxID=1458463 RepID=UPI00054D4E5C|nr:helix-turn-helix domain-containing protein [Butyrivibrio sp. AE2032]
MYKDCIQKILDKIEAGLKDEIDAKALAQEAGYSMFHFYRIFQDAVGFPVMQYILRRKLLNAIYEIGTGRKKSDVTYEYGFETYSGFYRSFVRETGYTPTEYLRKFKAKKPYRINLLQEEHIMINHKLITEVLSNWDIQDQKVSDIVFPETGEISDTSKFVGDEYVIKYTANLGNTKKAIEIAGALNNVGLSAPTIIPTRDGRECVQEGEIYFTLYRKINGERVMAGKLYLDDYQKKARFTGEIIGWLDKALSAIDTAADEADTYDAVKSWALPKLSSGLGLDDTFTNRFLDEFGNLYKSLPRQVIHRDPNPSNIIVADDKWGFIDFELSERNVRIFDPCYAATAILSETFEDGNNDKFMKWISIMKEMIAGYDSIVKLTEEEKKAVPYIILANQFISTAYFADKGRYEELYTTNRKMTRSIIDNFEKMKIE